MGVDYRKQYEPSQLEPFWPNEIVKMSVAVLCTLAIIMFLAILPTLLSMLHVHGVIHEELPADPSGPTPVGIKPEWYFLAVYQHLRLMPTQFLGISGKTLGVLSQGPVVLLVLLLPFWYRRTAHRRPGRVYRFVVSLCIVGFLGLTLWGGWPEYHDEHGEHLVPVHEYIGAHPMIFIMMAGALIVFYVLIAHERRAIRRILDGHPPQKSDQGDDT